MMTAFDCYKQYTALKQHFTQPSYDYFKYNGKTRANAKSFESRKDKLYFMKVAKHPDPLNYMLSNLLENNKAWIRDIAYSEASNKTYQNWLKRKQSLIYNFQQELSTLNEDFDSNFKSVDNTHPFVVKLYLQNKISLETLVMLVDLVKCTKYWSNQHQYDPIIEDVLTKIMKYRPFMEYDREKVKNIVIDRFSDK